MRTWLGWTKKQKFIPLAIWLSSKCHRLINQTSQNCVELLAWWLIWWLHRIRRGQFTLAHHPHACVGIQHALRSYSGRFHRPPHCGGCGRLCSCVADCVAMWPKHVCYPCSATCHASALGCTRIWCSKDIRSSLNYEQCVKVHTLRSYFNRYLKMRNLH